MFSVIWKMGFCNSFIKAVSRQSAKILALKHMNETQRNKKKHFVHKKIRTASMVQTKPFCQVIKKRDSTSSQLTQRALFRPGFLMMSLFFSFVVLLFFLSRKRCDFVENVSIFTFDWNRKTTNKALICLSSGLIAIIKFIRTFKTEIYLFREKKTSLRVSDSIFGGKKM